ncbi:hypothetical protein ACH5RR_041223 [Cinchona calisaya]|uniref:MBD domain-containing protein n=1 Tax=Cinchona calisaya TaxID=153742 RepID=A0ABD2XVK4_9GENT
MVIEFVSTKDVCQGTSHSVSEHDQNSTCSKSEASMVVVERKESLEWLPRGWIIESKNRKKGSYAGAIYKYYIDPLTLEFHSKKDVLRFLKIGDIGRCPKKIKRSVLKLVENDVSYTVVPLTLDVSEDKKLCLELIRVDKLADSSQPKTGGSKIDVKVVDNGAVSGIATFILNEQK